MKGQKKQYKSREKKIFIHLMSWQDEGVSFVDKYFVPLFRNFLFFLVLENFLTWRLSNGCPWGLHYISSFVKLYFFCIFFFFGKIMDLWQVFLGEMERFIYINRNNLSHEGFNKLLHYYKIIQM